MVNWADNDWDGDGISNTVELLQDITAPFDHDNDGTRDDIDEDDDEDGMHDEDEVILWPTRFNRNSTNPWDHDDFGDGEAMANPNDAGTGPTPSITTTITTRGLTRITTTRKTLN